MEVQKHFSSIVLCKTNQFLQHYPRSKKIAKFFKFIENWFKLFWFSCSKRAGWSSTDAETIVNSNIKSLPQLQYHVLLTRTNFSTFSSIRIFFHRHLWFTGQQEKWGYRLYSFLPLPLAHEHSYIYLQFWIWND